MAEKDLHRKLREWAYGKYGEIDIERGTGIIKIIKMTMLAQYGEAGATDWLVLVKRRPVRSAGHCFFIELKNPDGSGECTEKQLHWHAQVRELGFHVYVVDDLNKGKIIITEEVEDL